MKNILLFSLFSLLFSACDRVTNPYPKVASSDLDQSLYPGNWSDYIANEWPMFTTNTNTNRNVMIEDFTGHTCNNCPPANSQATLIANNNPGRVYVATLHTGPTGMGSLQAVQLPDYPTDWTNPNGLEIGTFFGSIPGSAFQGNPRGTVSRVLNSGQLTLHPSSWLSQTNNVLAANVLKVNLQSHANYYPTTRGLFVHTEVDLLDESLVDNLSLVVYLIEDSIIGDQKLLDNSHDSQYVHKEVMRGTIDNRAFGRAIDATVKDANGNYYLNYSYKLPDVYNPNIMHVLIFVIDQTTHEVYQVIKQELIE